jgi:hypothetical protein
MKQFRDDNADNNISDEVFARIEKKLVTKADGRFFAHNLTIEVAYNCDRYVSLGSFGDCHPQEV